MASVQILPGGEYVPSSYGYWIPPHVAMATPASTVISTPAATPTAPTMQMPSAQVVGTPAWLPGTINTVFTPANSTQAISLPGVPTNGVPMSAPATIRMPTSAPATAARAPSHYSSARSTPESLIVPLPVVESEPEDDEPPKVIRVERKRTRKTSSIKTITRVPCCGSCFVACNCSFEDTGSPTVISCGCQPGHAADPLPTAAPSSHISWHSYYPDTIYDFRHRPPPTAAPPPKEKEKHRFFLYKNKKPATPAQWAENAARQRPLNQVQAKHFHPEGVELHPLLNKASTTLFFNVLESKDYITLADGESMASIETHHATCPPLIKLELVSWLHSTPIVLENASGVTVGDIIDAVLACTRTIVPAREVHSWSPERRGIIYQWYWHNRTRIHGMSRYLTVGDTFEGYTSFEGLSNSQQAKKEDRRAKDLPHCTLVLSLGLDGYIPGLRSQFESPY